MICVLALALACDAYVAAPRPFTPRSTTSAYFPAWRAKPLPTMPRVAPLVAVDGAGSSFLDAIPGGLAGALLAPVGVILIITFVAGRGSLEAGAALMLVFFSGDPDERAESWFNNNELVKKAALAVTPSAWKKSYGGVGAGSSIRSEVNSELNFSPNFEGFVLGCIDADFCK